MFMMGQRVNYSSLLNFIYLYLSAVGPLGDNLPSGRFRHSLESSDPDGSVYVCISAPLDARIGYLPRKMWNVELVQ